MEDGKDAEKKKVMACHASSRKPNGVGTMAARYVTTSSSCAYSVNDWA